MSWGPVRPAAPGDIPPLDGGALAQAQQRWLTAQGLPDRWSGRSRFVILDTGFGAGHRFLATWATWRQQGRRSERLTYLAIAPRPPSRDQLARALSGSPQPDLATELIAHWPPLTPDLHTLALAGGRLRLLLAFGELATVLPELVAQVDAFSLADEEPAAPQQPFWNRWRLRQLTRLAAPGATLVSTHTAAPFRDGLSAAGFVVSAATSGAHDQADGLTIARFAPRFLSAPPPGRRALLSAGTAAPCIAVIGAGLAGSAVAQALAVQGLAVQVFDRQPGPANETSGQAGGLFHGTLHAGDGPHTRWLRAAALRCAQTLQPLVHSGALSGAVDGLLRGEQALAPAQMSTLLHQLTLPADYLQVRAGAFNGGRDAGWFYPGGGWVSPAEACTLALATPGISTHFNRRVDRLQPMPGGWQLQDASGTCLQQVDAVVLCNAADGARLLAPWAGTDLPLRQVRGQTTLLPAHLPGLPALPTLALPLADTGYALRLRDGRLLCGATSDIGDDHAGLRDTDHARNLATLQRLTGWAGAVAADALQGRVGWRLRTDDRLPLLGPLPDAQAAAAAGRRIDQPRLLPRLPGLYVFTALGSRGITQAPLAAETLAAWICGDALPLPASLLDALDVARYSCRAARRATAS